MCGYFALFSSRNTYVIILNLICRNLPCFLLNAMQHSPSCDFLNEAHHLTSQIDIINGRALELDNLICYVQAWLDVFRADVVFAEGRIGEIKCSIATCKSLVNRARVNTLTFSDPNSSLVFPLVSETADVSAEAADPSVVARLDKLVAGLRATAREVNNICEERRLDTQEILAKAESLLKSEFENLEQWVFLKDDLLRKETAFTAFSAVISGAAADYRCTKTKLEERVGALLSAATVSL